jgi:hypothetical protein
LLQDRANAVVEKANLRVGEDAEITNGSLVVEAHLQEHFTVDGVKPVLRDAVGVWIEPRVFAVPYEKVDDYR